MPNSAEVRAIQDFIDNHGVTVCPTAYVVPIAGATPLEQPVPSYDLNFFSQTALEKVHALRDITWNAARFREKLEQARKKADRRRSRTPLPHRPRTPLPD